MRAHQEPSVEALRQESERTRAALTATAMELRERVKDTAAELKARVSPAHLKDELKGYVREGSSNLVHSIEDRVRQNPLQAVAIGAALAYPLLGIVRAVPLPFMLIGAGLLAARNAKTLTNTAAAAGQSARQHASEIAAAAETSARDQAQRLSGSVQQGVDALSTGVASAAGAARATAHDVRDSISGMGRSIANSVSDTAAQAMDAGVETLSAVKDSAAAASRNSRNALHEMVERNPLLFAGLGIAAGAVLAASIRRSAAENRLFGHASDSLKESARQSAQQGIDRAKEAAAGVIDEAASVAEQHGLGAERLKAAVAGLTENVKAVAQRGMQTATGENEPGSRSSTRPDKL